MKDVLCPGNTTSYFLRALIQFCLTCFSKKLLLHYELKKVNNFFMFSCGDINSMFLFNINRSSS